MVSRTSNLVSYYRMCSVTIQGVCLLQNVFSYMVSRTSNKSRRIRQENLRALSGHLWNPKEFAHAGMLHLNALEPSLDL